MCYEMYLYELWKHLEKRTECRYIRKRKHNNLLGEFMVNVFTKLPDYS